MSNAEPVDSLSRAQIEVFAAGLHRIASCDGIHARERAIIVEFLTEARATDLVEKLDELPFDPVVAYRVLESSWLRSTFLSAALLLVKIDGSISAAEAEMIQWLMRAFGVPGNVDTLASALSAEGFPT
jgi:hypothetical protein